MLNDIFKFGFDIQTRFYAYTVGSLYLAPIYFFGLFIPPFKQLLQNYESPDSNNSKLFITITSATIYFGVFCYATYIAEGFIFSFIQYLFWFIGYFVWGYFALFLLADFKHRRQDAS